MSIIGKVLPEVQDHFLAILQTEEEVLDTCIKQEMDSAQSIKAQCYQKRFLLCNDHEKSSLKMRLNEYNMRLKVMKENLKTAESSFSEDMDKEEKRVEKLNKSLLSEIEDEAKSLKEEIDQVIGLQNSIKTLSNLYINKGNNDTIKITCANISAS